MDEIQLLAIIEVPYSSRIQCMANNCGHYVHKRVHIINHNGRLKAYGSICFAREYHGNSIRKSSPKYTSKAGRTLTAEERELLASNAEHLIEKFESELSLKNNWIESKPTQNSQETKSHQSRKVVRKTNPRINKFTQEEKELAESEARKILSERYPGIDLDSPGFNGLLQMETEGILFLKKF